MNGIYPVPHISPRCGHVNAYGEECLDGPTMTIHTTTVEQCTMGMDGLSCGDPGRHHPFVSTIRLLPGVWTWVIEDKGRVVDVESSLAHALRIARRLAGGERVTRMGLGYGFIIRGDVGEVTLIPTPRNTAYHQNRTGIRFTRTR